MRLCNVSDQPTSSRKVILFVDNRKKNPGPPTLKTIAYLTGLGISTVSRALKDGPELSAATRARVKLIAQQVGYRPNRAGVRLKTGKTNVITVVLNAQEDGAGFFAKFVYGISSALAGTGYHLVVTPYSLSDPMEPIRYIVETGSADGVIFSRTQPDDPRARYLAEHRIPFATHGRTELPFAHPFHDFDNDAFAFDALRILAERGRSRIVLIGPPPGLTYHKHTHQGYERGLRDFGLTGIPSGSVDIDASTMEIHAAGQAMASMDAPPDGIVCSAAHASIAALVGMRDRGLVAGRDFDVVTKHSTEFIALLAPAIISIPEDFSAAGNDVARMVIAAIAGIDPSELQTIAYPAAGGS